MPKYYPPIRKKLNLNKMISSYKTFILKIFPIQGVLICTRVTMNQKRSKA